MTRTSPRRAFPVELLNNVTLLQHWRWTSSACRCKTFLEKSRSPKNIIFHIDSGLHPKSYKDYDEQLVETFYLANTVQRR
jgi:hypothetical protein